MFKTIIQAAALAAAVLSTVPVQAQDVLPDVRVSYGDLDLSKPADIKRLDRRLSRAIAATCPSANGTREMSQLQAIARCRSGKKAEIASLRQTALAAAQTRKATFAVTAP